jgi:hypothetical protein
VLGLTPVSRLKSLVLSFLTHSQLPCLPLMPLLQHLDYFCRKSGNLRPSLCLWLLPLRAEGKTSGHVLPSIAWPIDSRGQTGQA